MLLEEARVELRSAAQEPPHVSSAGRPWGTRRGASASSHEAAPPDAALAAFLERALLTLHHMPIFSSGGGGLFKAKAVNAVDAECDRATPVRDLVTCAFNHSYSFF
jgi:hypothetical protein